MSDTTTYIADLAHYQWDGTAAAKKPLASLAAQFENQSRWYSTFLKDILPTDRKARILDIPCGHGNILFFLKKLGYTNVSGFELDKNNVQVATELGLPAQVGNALEVLKAEQNIELLFCVDFLEHLEKQDVLGFLQLCHTSLKKGGQIALRMPVTDSIFGAYDVYNGFTHKWGGNSNVIRQLFEQAGFTVNSIRDERPVLYKPLNYFRLGLFYFASTLTNFYLRALGQLPRTIWSPSAWIFATK